MVYRGHTIVYDRKRCEIDVIALIRTRIKIKQETSRREENAMERLDEIEVLDR